MGSPFSHSMSHHDHMAMAQHTMPNTTTTNHTMKMAGMGAGDTAATTGPCGDTPMSMPMSMHQHDASMWMTTSATRIGRKYYKALYRYERTIVHSLLLVPRWLPCRAA